MKNRGIVKRLLGMFELENGKEEEKETSVYKVIEKEKEECPSKNKKEYFISSGMYGKVNPSERKLDLQQSEFFNFDRTVPVKNGLISAKTEKIRPFTDQFKENGTYMDLNGQFNGTSDVQKKKAEKGTILGERLGGEKKKCVDQ